MVALGGRMVDFAKSLLVASAQDDALEKPCQACADIGKVIAETSHDNLDGSWVVEGKQFAVIYPTFSKKAPAVSLRQTFASFLKPRGRY